MSTRPEKEKPDAHAVFFPFPAQGHITAALHLAKLLHVRGGVRITFVHSDRNLRRLLRARGPAALAGAPGFGFASVPDGLPPASGDDDDSVQVMGSLLSSLDTFVPHLKKLLDDLSASGAPATCVVSDIDPVLRAAAGHAGVRAVAFWTTSACGLLASLHCQQLVHNGIVPLKDEEQLSNDYLDSTVIGPVPGMPADMRLRDMASFVRTTDPDDPVLRVVLGHMEALRTAAAAVVLNTFGELEGEAVAAMSAVLPPIYTVGPLPLLTEEQRNAGGSPLLAEETLSAAGGLSKEDDGCLAWLGSKAPRSVVYANFGSIVVLTSQQVEEFAWGLANSGYHFLMVIRGTAATAALPPEFVEETKDRGYVTSWCPQREVLRHQAVGVFLTHCGWNSMLDAIGYGMPMLCWPFGADQHTNRRFACTEWRVGVEIGSDVKRGEVDALVREVMGGEKGREMRARAAEWKQRAATASQPGGPSWVNLDRLVNEILHPSCV